MNSNKLNNIAEDIITASKILIKKGICEAFGHVSARIPGGEQFYITPRSSLAFVCDPDDLVLMNLHGEKVEGKNQQPLETWLHTCIYRARPDIGAITRTHSFTTSSFSIACKPVRPVHDFGAVLLGEIPVFNDSRLIENESIGTRLATFISKGTGALLRGNGTAILGKNVAEALVRSIYLEESAALQLKSQLLGNLVYLTPEETYQLGTQLLDSSHVLRAWEYYKWEAGCGRQGT